MASEINKITRKEHDLGGYYDSGYYSTMYNSPTGDYISVDDLREWLHWHVKERTISTIYSDLEKALK